MDRNSSKVAQLVRAELDLNSSLGLLPLLLSPPPGTVAHHSLALKGPNFVIRTEMSTSFPWRPNYRPNEILCVGQTHVIPPKKANRRDGFISASQQPEECRALTVGVKTDSGTRELNVTSRCLQPASEIPLEILLLKEQRGPRPLFCRQHIPVLWELSLDLVQLPPAVTPRGR